MRELQRTDRLSIATVIFILVIIIGILTMREPDLKYSRDFDASARDSQSMESVVRPADAAKWLQENNPKVAFIDIRNIYDYDRGHLANAIHIPKIELLDQDKLEILDKFRKDEMQVVLYGKDQLDAEGAGMLLRDIGYDNVKVLMGGYAYMKSLSSEQTGEDHMDYLNEEPKYDYAEMASSPTVEMKNATEVKAPEVVMPVRKVKGKAEGGC